MHHSLKFTRKKNAIIIIFIVLRELVGVLRLLLKGVRTANPGIKDGVPSAAGFLFINQLPDSRHNSASFLLSLDTSCCMRTAFRTSKRFYECRCGGGVKRRNNSDFIGSRHNFNSGENFNPNGVAAQPTKALLEYTRAGVAMGKKQLPAPFCRPFNLI